MWVSSCSIVPISSDSKSIKAISRSRSSQPETAAAFQETFYYSPVNVLQEITETQSRAGPMSAGNSTRGRCLQGDKGGSLRTMAKPDENLGMIDVHAQKIRV